MSEEVLTVLVTSQVVQKCTFEPHEKWSARCEGSWKNALKDPE